MFKFSIFDFLIHFKVDNVDSEKKNPNYVLHKREVYHLVWAIVVASIKSSAKFGESWVCGDEILRVLFITIKIFAIDIEEQYVVSR